MRYWRYLPVLALLAGCGGSTENLPPPCPAAEIVYNTHVITVYIEVPSAPLGIPDIPVPPGHAYAPPHAPVHEVAAAAAEELLEWRDYGETADSLLTTCAK